MNNKIAKLNLLERQVYKLYYPNGVYKKIDTDKAVSILNISRSDLLRCRIGILSKLYLDKSATAKT